MGLVAGLKREGLRVAASVAIRISETGAASSVAFATTTPAALTAAQAGRGPTTFHVTPPALPVTVGRSVMKFGTKVSAT